MKKFFQWGHDHESAWVAFLFFVALTLWAILGVFVLLAILAWLHERGWLGEALLFLFFLPTVGLVALYWIDKKKENRWEL